MGKTSDHKPDRGSPSRRTADWRHLSRLFEQLPPHAIEAETSLLGSMLIDPKAIGDVLMVVRAGDDFYKPANGAIFEAMTKLYDTSATLDLVQLNQVLADQGTLDAVGGLDYLVELANAVPTASNAVHYARLVREKAAIRHLIDAAGEISQRTSPSRFRIRASARCSRGARTSSGAFAPA